MLKKPDTSSLLLIVFLTLLGSGILLSELFHLPNLDLSRIESLQIPIKKDFLKSVHFIEVNNQLSTFTFRKEQEKDHWDLISPKNLPAKRTIINQLFNELSSIVVKKIIVHDEINLRNYSLTNPVLTITLKQTEGASDSNNKNSLIIKMGMVNPIDNTTYLTFSNKKIIYQIEKLSRPFESLALSDFVDSKIFTLSLYDIYKFNLSKTNYYSKKKEKVSLLKFKRVDPFWYDMKKNKLSTDKVEKYINKVISVKSHLILDKSSKSVKKNLTRYLKSPLFEIVVADKQGRNYRYELSQLLEKIPELKIERKQNALIWASNKDYPYLIKKDYLRFLSKNINEFKELSVKKFFY